MADASPERMTKSSTAPDPPTKTAQIVSDLGRMELESKIAAIMDLIKTADLDTLKGVFVQLPTFLHELPLTEIWHFCNSRKRKIGTPMKTPLHVAVTFREYEVVEYLVHTMGYAKALRDDNWLKNGLVADCIRDIHEIDDNGFENKLKILHLLFSTRPGLIESKAKKGTWSKPVYTPLLVAADRVFTNGKQVEFMKHLLLHKADPNAKDMNGRTPLQLLVRLCPFPADTDLREMANLLIKNGADPNHVHNPWRSLDWLKSKTES